MPPELITAGMTHNSLGWKNNWVDRRWFVLLKVVASFLSRHSCAYSENLAPGDDSHSSMREAASICLILMMSSSFKVGERTLSVSAKRCARLQHRRIWGRRPGESHAEPLESWNPNSFRLIRNFETASLADLALGWPTRSL
jgi:hypothetical protein